MCCRAPARTARAYNKPIGHHPRVAFPRANAYTPRRELNHNRILSGFASSPNTPAALVLWVGTHTPRHLVLRAARPDNCYRTRSIPAHPSDAPVPARVISQHRRIHHIYHRSYQTLCLLPHAHLRTIGSERAQHAGGTSGLPPPTSHHTLACLRALHIRSKRRRERRRRKGEAHTYADIIHLPSTCLPRTLVSSRGGCI